MPLTTLLESDLACSSTYTIKVSFRKNFLAVCIMQSSTRVLFFPPTEDEFSSLLGQVNYLSGSGLENIRIAKFPAPGRLHQRGGGFFSSLARLAKSAVPFLYRTFAPSALKFTQDVIQDVSGGESGLKGALKKRGVQALKGVATKLMKGGRNKRKRKIKKKNIKKVHAKKRRKTCNKKIKDVFDMI